MLLSRLSIVLPGKASIKSREIFLKPAVLAPSTACRTPSGLCFLPNRRSSSVLADCIPMESLLNPAAESCRKKPSLTPVGFASQVISASRTR